MSENISTSLFRSEVLSSINQYALGEVRLGQSGSVGPISLIAAIICAAFVAFIFIGSISKKARVTGLLMPSNGTLEINSPNSGILTRSYVHEGMPVKIGQPLFELSTERKIGSGDMTTLIEQQLASRVDSMEAEQRLRLTQYNEKKSASSQRLQNLDAENSQLLHEIELTQRRVFLAEQSLKKYERLEASGYVSSVQAQQKQEELIDIRTRSSSLERAKVQLLATRQQIEADLNLATTELQSALNQIRTSRAKLQQEIVENSGRKATLISAPSDGTITTITYTPGQSVVGGQALATVIPSQSATNAGPDLEVHLYAPSRRAGFVAPGQKVLIRYQAFPYQKFGLQQGVISDVSKTPFSVNELPANLAGTILANAQQFSVGSNNNEALYRIKVRLEKTTISAYGKEQLLKPGMTLEADIVQDERKIWEWIADPLFAISG